MKYAIISDTHGNIFALKECIKYIEKIKVDSIIWCGDYITDVPRSHEVLETIRDLSKKYKSYIIRGNREDYIIDYHNSEIKNWSMDNKYGSLLCAYNELTKEDIEFISNLPETCLIDENKNNKIFVSHKADFKKGNDCKYKIFGHSHKQYMSTRHTSIYINPGSVGFPTSNNIGSEFSILEINDNFSKIENYQIQYDINEAIDAIKKSALNKTVTKWGDAVIKLIKTGTDYPKLYVSEVSKIAKERNLNKDLDKLPVEIWEEARKRLDI